MKKSLVFMLFVSLLLSVVSFTSCGGDGKKDDNKSSATRGAGTVAVNANARRVYDDNHSKVVPNPQTLGLTSPGNTVPVQVSILGYGQKEDLTYVVFLEIFFAGKRFIYEIPFQNQKFELFSDTAFRLKQVVVGFGTDNMAHIYYAKSLVDFEDLGVLEGTRFIVRDSVAGNKDISCLSLSPNSVGWK